MINIDKTIEVLLQELKVLKQENATLNSRYEKDIYQCKPEEESLQKSKQKIKTFLDSTLDLTFLKDESFHQIMANRAMCTFYGKIESKIIETKVLNKLTAGREIRKPLIIYTEDDIICQKIC